MSKEKLKKVTNQTAKGGFVSPMAQYLKYGDWDPSEVATGTLTHRSMAYDPEVQSRASYGGIAYGQGYKAFRHGGKLWRTGSAGGHTEQKV